jgi:hypothetical protein
MKTKQTGQETHTVKQTGQETHKVKQTREGDTCSVVAARRSLCRSAYSSLTLDGAMRSRSRFVQPYSSLTSCPDHASLR